MPDPISWSYAAPYLVGALLIGYALGSIPFGLLLTCLAGLGDIRKVGSGNIGTTNVLRTGRKDLAAATLLLDAGKGGAAVLLGAAYGPDTALVAGFGAVVGHLFPIWLRFQGGKGVATGLGVFAALAWQAGAAAGLTWLAVAGLFRYSSLAALISFAAAPFYAYFFTGDLQRVEMTAVIAALVWLRHYANIRRLLTGDEPKIGARK